jgi:Flp pilus assembly protein TadD
VVLVALFHGPSLRNQFVYDDAWTIVDNTFLRRPANLRALLGQGPARAGVPDAGRPTMLATEMLDHALWGLAPRGFHLQSVLWHLGVSLLFFLGLRRLLGQSMVPVVAASLFAVHPLSVEAVAAINYREDLLAAFFALLALLAIGRARQAAAGQGRGPALALRALAAISLLVGLFAKENASVAPILLVLLDVLLARDGARAALRRGAPDYLLLAVVVAGAFAWRWWAVGAPLAVSRTAEIPAAHLAPTYLVPRAIIAFVAGLGQTLFPLGMSPEYADRPPGTATIMLALGSLLVLAGLLILGLRVRRRAPWVALGLLAAVAAYLPNFGLVPLSNVRADRYFYLPSLGLSLALAWTLVAGFERLRLVREREIMGVPAPWVALAALVLALGLRTLQQGRVWRNDLAVWTRATALYPDAPRAWNGLCQALLHQGRAGAVEAARRSLALADDADGLELLGLALAQRRDLEGAHAAFDEALAAGLAPQRRAELLNNLGYLELRMQRREDALARFEEAQRLAPTLERPALNAARARIEVNDLGRATSTLRALVARAPESLEGWKLLALALERQGDLTEAHRALEQALALAPGDREVLRTIARLAGSAIPRR